MDDPASIHVNIHLRHAAWKKPLRPYCKTIRHICSTVLADTRLAAIPCRCELSVVLADNGFIRELNRDYRGKDKATNVLSFPSDEQIEARAKTLARGAAEYELGDIVLAYETVEREAWEQHKSFRDHAAHLIVHGMLHLLGHDHEEEEEAVKMEKREIKILKKLNVKNPYLSNRA